MSGKATPQEKVEEILRMNDNGCFVSEIVKKTGVTERTVRRLIHKNGEFNRRGNKVVTFNPQLSMRENAELNGYKSSYSYIVALKRNNITDYKEQKQLYIKQRVIELYNMGICIKELSTKILNIGQGTAKRILLSEGIDIYRNAKVWRSMYIKQRCEKPETEEMEKEILRLTMKGFTKKEIWEILNKKVSKSFISKVKAKYMAKPENPENCLSIKEIREKWEDKFDYMMPKEICKEMGEEYNKCIENRISKVKQKNLKKKKINSFPE